MRTVGPIWSLQDVMLAGQGVREVIRTVPLPGDTPTPQLHETVRNRLTGWFDAKQRCDAVRVLDEHGDEVYRYTAFDLLEERNKRRPRPESDSD